MLLDDCMNQDKLNVDYCGPIAIDEFILYDNNSNQMKEKYHVKDGKITKAQMNSLIHIISTI